MVAKRKKKIERLNLNLSLNFDKEPPKTEKGGKGRANPIYEPQVKAFMESNRDWASVEGIPKENLNSVSAGLRSAIARLGKEDQIKSIIRKNGLYLITKKYSDEQKWKWKAKRKTEGKGVIAR